jgi:hypothetical protein
MDEDDDFWSDFSDDDFTQDDYEDNLAEGKVQDFVKFFTQQPGKNLSNRDISMKHDSNQTGFINLSQL